MYLYFHFIAQKIEHTKKKSSAVVVPADLMCRYFSAGWVQPLYFNPLHDGSKFCILCCNVMPSMALRKKPYRTWAVIEKPQATSCGGKIREAYCTCPAG